MLPRIAIICQKLLQKLPKIFNCFPIVFPLLSNRSSVPFQLLPNCFSIISNCLSIVSNCFPITRKMLASSTADNKTILSYAGNQISFGSQYSHSIITSSITNNAQFCLQSKLPLSLQYSHSMFISSIKHHCSISLSNTKLTFHLRSSIDG